MISDAVPLLWFCRVSFVKNKRLFNGVNATGRGWKFTSLPPFSARILIVGPSRAGLGRGSAEAQFVSDFGLEKRCQGQFCHLRHDLGEGYLYVIPCVY